MNPFIPANPSASYVASQQEVAERLQQFDAWWDIKGSDATDFSKDWEVEKYSMPRIQRWTDSRCSHCPKYSNSQSEGDKTV